MNINMKYWGVAALFASGAVFTACSDDETTVLRQTIPVPPLGFSSETSTSIA